MHLCVLLVAVVATAVFWAASAQQRSGCESSCGNVDIPFPFGIGERCSYGDSSLLVTCDPSSGEPTPFLGPSTNNITIKNISTSSSEIEIMVFVAQDCYNTTGPTNSNQPSFTSGSFGISTKNRFVAIGCDTHAYFSGERGEEIDGSGCILTCGKESNITDGNCLGVGCCEVAVPEGLRSFEISLSSYNNHSNITNFNPCSYGFFIQEGKFNFSTSYLRGFEKKMPMLLDWAIGNSTCNELANKNPDDSLCKGKSSCDHGYGGPGYRCRCNQGYEGNPYIETGCKNINECANSDHGCPDGCEDTDGGYKCLCPKGYSGERKKDGTGCVADKSSIVEIIVGTLAAAIFLVILVTWLYLGHKKRKLVMLREKFFRQNGGIMLQQRISGDGNSDDRAKVFTTDELKSATNNYEESRIIGRGGYGTVYKGVLSDNRIVAIKKSKLGDQTKTQIEQFINEVVILSQINHRNVVKLIGCCLETEVPLLVYEFIPNGTLSDHIHNKGKSSGIPWDVRLRIATETAEALSYLHSAASVPIIHRDIKPTNILLDDSYVAKVADFGASRLIPTDQIELATIVQGTLGYLDPEYLLTNQLTDKSDVYSFGVVLVELLTGKKALSFERPEEQRNLPMYFLSCLKRGRLLQVLDENLKLNEVPNEITKVSRLAERCLCVKGDERPAMKEVAIELEGILATTIRKHPWVQSSSNEEEDEYLLRQQPAINDYEFINGTSTTFDSMNTHTMLHIASGR